MEPLTRLKILALFPLENQNLKDFAKCAKLISEEKDKNIKVKVIIKN